LSVTVRNERRDEKGGVNAASLLVGWPAAAAFRLRMNERNPSSKEIRELVVSGVGGQQRFFFLLLGSDPCPTRPQFHGVALKKKQNAQRTRHGRDAFSTLISLS